MAFTADTRNHFLREAKREYGVRRSNMECNKTRKESPTWSDLTEQQREEWAQYMHDEWLKRPNPPGLRKPDLFSDLLYPVPNMRCTQVPVDISENEAVNRRVDELEQKHNELANTLEQRIKQLQDVADENAITITNNFENGHRNVQAIYNRIAALEQPQMAAPMVMEVKLDTSEVQQAMTDTLAEIDKVKIEVLYLRKQKKWLQDAHAEQFKLLQKRNTEIEELNKECDARKQDEVKLRQSIELLAQELAAERTMPVPYTITVEDFEAVKRNFKGYWFMRARWFNTYNIVWMTKEQHELVKRFGHFEEL